MARRKKDQKPPPLQVVIAVSGGVADVLYKPLGIALVILDYDVEGCGEHEPGMSRDPDGKLCCIRELDSSEHISGPEEWPIIKKAQKGVYSRPWKCPDCGATVEHSYDALAEVGSPLCPCCEVEMTHL